MSAIEGLLDKTVRFEVEHSVLSIGVIIVLTLLVGSGISGLQMSSDMKQQLPDVESMQVDDKVSSQFGGSSSVVFIYRIDFDRTNIQKDATDIRNPEIFSSMKNLEQSLEDHPRVTSVRSPTTPFGQIPGTLQGVKTVLDRSPGSEGFFNDDFTASYLVAQTDFPSREQEIKGFESDLEEKVSETARPGNIEIRMAGQPILRSEINDLLRQDLKYTTGIAAFGLFFISVLYTRSFVQAVQIVTPLAVAMIWLFGVAGFAGIPITISTVVVGAMVMGLGMEYGSFLVERFDELKAREQDIEEALKVSVPLAGDSIAGSSSTAVLGFSTLALATIPMIRQMGIMLALGVFLALVHSLFLGPLIILYSEKAGDYAGNWLTGRLEK